MSGYSDYKELQDEFDSLDAWLTYTFNSMRRREESMKTLPKTSQEYKLHLIALSKQRSSYHQRFSRYEKLVELLGKK